MAATTAPFHVTRSSTRLHAPPGGTSSLSFGPGGFGTADPVVDSEAPPTTAAAEPMQMYRDRGSTPPTASASGMRAPLDPAWNRGATATMPMGTSMSSSSSTMPRSSWQARDATLAPFSADPNSMPPPRTQATGTALGWGERGIQPPLTSSQRDQNWERKRREWLARKNAMAGNGNGGAGSGSWRAAATPSEAMRCGTSMPMPMQMPPSRGGPSPYESMPMPPGTASGAAYFDVGNPPSPLTKFVAQQTARNDNMVPPSRGGSGICMDVVHGTSCGGRPPSSLPPRMTPPSSYGYHDIPRTAATSTGACRATSRQPPGGHTNWSPYS